MSAPKGPSLATLLMAFDTRGWFHIASATLDFTPGPGWTLLALIDAEE